MDSRELKALEIAARQRITFADGAWFVPSQSGSGKYRVTLQPSETCTCDDFALRQQPCKHIIACRLIQERDHGGQAPVIDTETLPKKPTYKQDWPKYNLAQTTEKHRFQELLFDLCRGIEQPPRKPGKGRPPVLLSDAVFAAAFKVYSTVSCRRFMCDLNDAHKRGYLTQPIHYNSINFYLQDAGVTPVLYDLIARSSLPLRTVETAFAVDSSGFTTSRFVAWYDHKYGVTRREHDWIKVHIAVGTTTNVITAAEIRDRDANDSPLLPVLLNTTAKTFRIEEASADKGYSSVENIETIAGLGAASYIPFKVNASPAKGGLWEKMLGFYQFKRDEFLAHYHKRSNIESTFAAVKAKFGDHVRSKTDTAMRNEVLCKLLCHNICTVLGSQIELGIEPIFWPEKSHEPANILPMPSSRVP